MCRRSPGLLSVSTLTYVVDPGGDTFGPGDPPHGVCWSPTDDALEVEPTWVRMDDPAGTRLATSWSISRGRQNELDKTVTGTATVTFDDLTGDLDVTNTTGPWYANLDPMKQAAISLMHPVTGEWHTLFRGFVAGLDQELQMFQGAYRGLNLASWNLVDAFDVFANVILTPGNHGYPVTSMTDFPNVYYNGEPSNLSGEDDVERHVDGRIVKLLDDAGWPGTGNTGRPGSPAPLRNIFSGNCTVQGVVYGRQDSLLQALFDAADAEFPGIANIYVSKEGVVTFHGRYARFFPERPGYGINHWYAGGVDEALIDPTVVPLAGPLRFYKSKDDVINSSIATARNDTPATAGVITAADTTSQGKYGFRSFNFEELLNSGGHDDDNNPTSRQVECNKFADYYVSNYKTPPTRCQTLRFQSRGPDSIGAEALWDLICGVELGDVITLTTAHMGGGGFFGDWFVEQIRYTAQPARADMHQITLELEVSPSTLYDNNPFGDWDDSL